MKSVKQHYLLTALGTRPKQTTYALGSEASTANHSPLALLQLLSAEVRPNNVLCLLTDQARKTSWDGFAHQVEKLGVSAEALDIPAADDSEEVAEIIRAVSEKIPSGSLLTLDITHGPRHVPFVFYALALYLSSFRNVQIAGAWHGKFESEKDDKPLINLQSLLILPQWFYAVRMFQETGFTKALATQFNAVRDSLPEGPKRGPSSTCARALDKFSADYESGFPMELGLAAGKLCLELETTPLAEMPGLDVPLATELGEVVLAVAQPLRFGHNSIKDGRSDGDWKKQYPLSRQELQRQAKLIDQYLERGQFSLGIRLMREWTVSLGTLHRGHAEEWLTRNVRRRIERELSAMSKQPLQQYLDDPQKDWGKFWDQLGKQRNQFAHNGMKQEVAKTKLEPIRTFWEKIKSAEYAWSSFGGGKGCLLITPLGMSPGVLYSAVKQIQPDSLLVLCSEQAKPGIDEALQRSGFSNNYDTLIMRDPFNGSDEIANLLKQSRGICLSADEVLVNFTGGTTMMGVAVQRLSEQACSDQRPCRRFVLTDKRPQEEQKQNPWVESDFFWLDKESDGDRDDD